MPTDLPPDPCIPQTLTAPDGAVLIACAHGGHVLGWTPAGGQQRLWLSPSTRCGPGLAVRGGIPVIFPQFAGRGPLPKHGLARDRAWEVLGTDSLLGTDSRPEAVTWRARLRDDESTRQVWPHPFDLELEARAGGQQLDVTLTVRNPSDQPWAFSAALHAYLAVGDPQTTIHGLSGRQGQDNAAAGRAVRLGTEGEALLAVQARDVAVPDAREPVRLDDPALGPLTLTAEGFGDRVVWNPGSGHGLSDVPDGAERDFVCIEPAQLMSIVVIPGGVWTGRLSLHSGLAHQSRYVSVTGG